MSADGNGGYGETSVRTILRDAGLRPTRQRIALGEILFGSGNRHVTAEMVYDEALGKSVPVSLATIYNTLHQFTAVGLLREVVVDSSKTYFDTNTSDHHHVFVEGRDEIIDLPENAVEIGTIGPLPSGAEISRVDVVVRVRRAR
ncbi:MAG: transcriptional repressor [Hyphomicrobiales bacterium]|nr:transcriptional repressor [Hyphomicrobiales bacterium]